MEMDGRSMSLEFQKLGVWISLPHVSWEAQRFLFDLVLIILREFLNGFSELIQCPPDIIAGKLKVNRVKHVLKARRLLKEC